MNDRIIFLFSALSVIAVFASLGAGQRAERCADYTLSGRKAGPFAVTGMLLGALVGGASTVGTAQMAYRWGMSAWWFTLGGGIGCLILGVRYASELRASGHETFVGMLGAEYGPNTARVAALSSTVGTFMSVVAQFLSGAAMLRMFSVFPDGLEMAAVCIVVLMFIAAGGLKSFARLGAAKIVMLYAAAAACALYASLNGATPAFIIHKLSFQPWFNPFGRGFFVDMGSCLSLIVGVFCTQIYIQAIFSASDTRTARQGALLSAFLMPPLGILGVWVGLAVRAWGVDIPPAQVLPWFLRNCMPPYMGGALWAVVFITVTGCAAGLVLGISTVISQDMMGPIKRICGKHREIGPLAWLRAVVIAVTVAAAVIGIKGSATLILEWSYLSMGLRGAGTFFPFVLAVTYRGRGILSGRAAFLSSLGGLGASLGWYAAGMPAGDALYPGLAVSGAICALAVAWGRKG